MKIKRWLSATLLWLVVATANAQVLPTAPQNGGTGVKNNAASTITISGAHSLSITLPGNTAITLPGSGTVLAGTPSGNTTVFGTTSGTLTNTHCVQIDSNGNFVDAGGVCTTGGGSGTVTAGLINQLAWYSAGGTAVGGLTTANNGVLITSAGGVPSISTTLPSGLTIPSATLSSPTMTTPALGTPASGVGTNLTGIPIGGLTGLGTGVASALADATNATGGFVTFSGALGTPSSGNGSNLTNLPWTSVTGTPTTLSGYGITNGQTNSLANTKIWVGNGSGLAAAVNASGDCTISNTGVLSCSSSNGTPFGTAAFQNTGTSGANIGLLNANKTDSGANTYTGNNTYSGVSTFGGSLVVKERTITSGATVTVSATTDYFLCINKTSGSATAVNLPATPVNGLTYLVKDCKGDAATNNITINPNSGLIDGNANFIMSNGYESVSVTYNGASWSIN